MTKVLQAYNRRSLAVVTNRVDHAIGGYSIDEMVMRTNTAIAQFTAYNLKQKHNIVKCDK